VRAKILFHNIRQAGRRWGRPSSTSNPRSPSSKSQPPTSRQAASSPRHHGWPEEALRWFLTQGFVVFTAQSRAVSTMVHKLILHGIWQRCTCELNVRRVIIICLVMKLLKRAFLEF
jgi:hypothetical protein